MFSGSQKPYTAVTVQIERMTKEDYEVEDLSGIVDLIEVIKPQATGPTEAARALRKKLKYGNIHRQLRALTILDALIQNAGSRFQRQFADEALLERLRVAATDTMSDNEVKQKCAILFRQWAVSYKSTPGLERIAVLYKELPKRKQPVRQENSKVLRETEIDEEAEQYGHSASASSVNPPLNSRRSPPTSPTTPMHLSYSARRDSASSSAITGSLNPFRQKTDKSGKKTKAKPFVLEKEKPAILQLIASSSVASTGLMNALRSINREHQRVSENREARELFENCKRLRKQVRPYLPVLEGGDLLGGLLQAHDQLTEALLTYEILDKSLEDDSDSEAQSDEGSGVPTTKPRSSSNVHQHMAGLSLNEPKPPPQPPRPSFIVMPPANEKGKGLASSDDEKNLEEEDENDPFADRNAVNTPRIEKGGMTWPDV